MNKLLARLPERFQWTLHNIVGHPISEILFQVGLKPLGDRIHDATLPVADFARSTPREGRG